MTISRLLLALLLLAPLPLRAHPLDALTAEEITRATALVRAQHPGDTTLRFVAVELAEPPKAAVLAGQVAPRRAQVVTYGRVGMAETTVDLAAGTAAPFMRLRGAQPPVLLSEWERAAKLTMEHADWQAAMRRRGYTAFDKLFCAPLTVGQFGTAEERGRRLLRVPCYDMDGTRNTVHGRPIEGLFAIVDLTAGRVLRVVDTGVVPTPPGPNRVDEATMQGLRAPMRPVLQYAPQGGNVRIEGQEVTWDHWRFHLRLDRRFGTILSLLRWQERDQPARMVMYQGYTSEMFVPYMDSSEAWYFRSYMDIGEYGFGVLSSRLRAGTDCPAHARFLDAVLPDEDGAPQPMEAVLCVFERNTGNPMWRHAEMIDETYEGRPEVELVVRSIPTIGNYDYVMDWVLTQRGEIRIEVGATGMDAVRGVRARSMAEPGAAAEARTGMLVAPGALGVWHDHYISFRLDLDIDGPVNSFMRERLAARSVQGGPRRSLWALERVPMPREGAVVPHHAPELWRVVNPRVRTALGHNPGFEIQAGHGATSLLDAQDAPQRRAAFSTAPLWVTAHDPSERHAAGAWPNQNPGGEGLPRFIRRNRPVENSDVVVWYTMGFHHLTRPEDWPVLPTKWHRLDLRPYGFFTRNPGITARTEFATP